jgi:hypothetical protein
MQVRFLDEDALNVAGDASREGIGNAERCSKGQHRNRVRTAKRGGKRGDGRAHDVSVWVAFRHHAPGRFGGDDGALRREPAGIFDFCPKSPQGAKLRHGEELVLVRGEPEIDRAPRLFEGNS